MTLKGNRRVWVQIGLQTGILLFFGICALRVRGGDEGAQLLFGLCMLPCALSLVSIAGVAQYLKWYVRVREGALERSGFSLGGGGRLPLDELAGYVQNAAGDLTLIDRAGRGRMDIRCCYLDEEDARRLLDLISAYGQPMRFEKQTNPMLQMLRDAVNERARAKKTLKR